MDEKTKSVDSVVDFEGISSPRGQETPYRCPRCNGELIWKARFYMDNEGWTADCLCDPEDRFWTMTVESVRIKSVDDFELSEEEAATEKRIWEEYCLAHQPESLNLGEWGDA